MLHKDMVGTVEQLGHPGTMRRNTAKVRWDNGHKDQWWPVNMLYRVNSRPDVLARGQRERRDTNPVGHAAP